MKPGTICWHKLHRVLVEVVGPALSHYKATDGKIWPCGGEVTVASLGSPVTGVGHYKGAFFMEWAAYKKFLIPIEDNEGDDISIQWKRPVTTKEKV